MPLMSSYCLRVAIHISGSAIRFGIFNNDGDDDVIRPISAKAIVSTPL